MLTKEQLIKEEKILYSQFKCAIFNTFNFNNYKQALEQEFKAFERWKKIAQGLEKGKRMTYFLADPHYGHDREFIWKQRGFSSIEQHDKCLLDNCKKLTVKDVLYIIGDVSCGRNSLENALEFLNKLTCKVFIVKGNHDGSLFKNKDKVNANIKFIDSVYLDINIGFQSITLCHYPMISWNRSHYNSLLIYGHVHNKKIPIDGKMFDVCPKKEHISPYSLDEIIDIVKSKPNNWDYIEKGLQQ